MAIVLFFFQHHRDMPHCFRKLITSLKQYMYVLHLADVYSTILLLQHNTAYDNALLIQIRVLIWRLYKLLDDPQSMTGSFLSFSLSLDIPSSEKASLMTPSKLTLPRSLSHYPAVSQFSQHLPLSEIIVFISLIFVCLPPPKCKRHKYGYLFSLVH